MSTDAIFGSSGLGQKIVLSRPLCDDRSPVGIPIVTCCGRSNLVELAARGKCPSAEIGQRDASEKILYCKRLDLGYFFTIRVSILNYWFALDFVIGLMRPCSQPTASMT